MSRQHMSPETRKLIRDATFCLTIWHVGKATLKKVNLLLSDLQQTLVGVWGSAPRTNCTVKSNI